MKRSYALSFTLALFFFSMYLGISGFNKIYASERITLVFSESTEIEKEQIQLGDICHVSGIDGDLVQKMKAIELGSVPLAGSTKKIDRDYVLLQLKKNDVDISNINLQIAEGSLVIRSSMEVTKEQIVGVVMDYLRRNIHEPAENYQIKSVSVSKNVLMPSGDISYQVIPSANKDLSGKITLAVNLMSGGKIIKKVWAIAEISIYMNVVMTARPLGRYKLISDTDIQLVKRDLSKLPHNIITNCDDVIGKRTRRAIDANTVLRPDVVEMPPLVKRGNIVSIIAESDNLKVSTLGKAKERGCLGQLIEVENLDSRKSVYARVLDENNVLVEF